MFERIRFARYALRFERAFRSDRWDDVKSCFTRDATYTVLGSNTRWDGVHRGPDAIVAFYKKMLDELDRKFDKRVPGLVRLPRVRDGVLVVDWKATYVLGAQRQVLHGTSRCRFEGGKIAELSDTMDADECKRWADLIGAH